MNPDGPGLGLDAEQVEVEQRVDVGAEQQPVSRVVVVQPSMRADGGLGRSDERLSLELQPTFLNGRCDHHRERAD